MWATLVLYLGGIATIARAGRLADASCGPRTALLFVVLGPLIALVALLLAVIVSSRVNDPRSAQQLGALVVLPITGVFVAQLVGAVRPRHASAARSPRLGAGDPDRRAAVAGRAACSTGSGF